MATIYGTPIANNWIASFAVSDWAIYPNSTTGGSSTTGSCDRWDYDSSRPCLSCGGYFGRGEVQGLFYVSPNGVSGQNPAVGFRVIILP